MRLFARRLGLAVTTLVLTVLVVSSITNQLPGVAAAPPGKYFDHLVLIAMENQGYADVFGDGHGVPAAPFLASLLAKSGTNPNYHSGLSPGCSEGCYIQLVAGDDYGAANGDRGIATTSGTIFGRFDDAGLTWQAFCENGCPRDGDHFPFLAISGLNVPQKVNSDATKPDFVAALNAATPPNFAWFTPTDNHNMHDNSVGSGDTYLKNFLVGNTGTIDNPAQGSLLASNVFKPGMRTVLMLWWDEYDPAPFLVYGETVKQAFISQAADQNIFSTTRLFLDNWGLAKLTNNDGNAPVMAEYFNVSPTATIDTYQWIPFVVVGAGAMVALVVSRKILPERKRSRAKPRRRRQRPITTTTNTA